MKRSYADALGKRPPERLSEYFDFQRWPDKAERKVTRMELLAILDRHFKAQQAMRWYTRLWRWLARPLGSRPSQVVPPTQGEIARGEATPEAGHG